MKFVAVIITFASRLSATSSPVFGRLQKTSSNIISGFTPKVVLSVHSVEFYNLVPNMVQKCSGLNRLVHTLSKLRLNDVKLFLIGLGFVFLLNWIVTLSWIPKFKCLSDGSVLQSTKQYSIFSLTDVSYAQNLANKINIYCYILTEPQSHLTKAYHVQTTWARRCTRFGFISSKAEKLMKMLAVDRTQDYVKHSWISMRETLRALHKQTYKAAYFLKADDTTYVIMENLRNALEYTDPRKPFIMGHIYKIRPNEFTLSGSFGYVLSRSALELIVLKGLDKLADCGPIQHVREDIQISKCAKALGIEFKDSIDMFGMSRFSNVTINNLFGTFNNSNNNSGTIQWDPIKTDYTQAVYDLKKLPASPLLISFGGLMPVKMYILEYLIYHLRPVGITHRILQHLPYSSSSSAMNRYHQQDHSA